MTATPHLPASDAPSASPVSPTYIEKGTPQFWRTASALAGGGFATFGLLYCVQPLLPVLSRDFGMNAAHSSLVLSSATLSLAFGLLITGPLSDAWTRKGLMVIALAMAAICTLLGAVMPTWAGLLAMRILTGFALSGMTAIAVTYLIEEIHPSHIGFAMGLFIGGNAIGGMSARLFTGVMVEYLSWRWALGLLGCMGLGAAFLFWRNLPPSRHFHPRKVSLSGLRDGYLLHLKDPFLPWVFLQAFLLMGCFVTFYNYVSYRLLEPPFSLSQGLIGMLSVVYLSGIYSSAKTGSLADRFGRERVFWPVVLMMLTGVLLTLSASLPVFFAGLLIFTFGFFGAHTVASSWIGARVKQAKGQATSIYQVCFYVGASLAGTSGGVLWHWAHWPGVVGLIVTMLIVSLGAATIPMRRG
jgi:YNFM family putative membrane transporter